MPDKALVEDLNALWMKAEGNYNAFDKWLIETIGKAYGVKPQILQRQVSYNRILTGDFQVVGHKNGYWVIE
jgi:hypothetical protein